MLTSMQSSS